MLANFLFHQDPQKRAIYDSGTDPEDRTGGMSSRASGFSSRGAQFDGELSPEDLFNMFFGGGGGGGGFGPGFATSFGGGPSAFTSLLYARLI